MSTGAHKILRFSLYLDAGVLQCVVVPSDAVRIEGEGSENIFYDLGKQFNWTPGINDLRVSMRNDGTFELSFIEKEIPGLKIMTETYKPFKKEGV